MKWFQAFGNACKVKKNYLKTIGAIIWEMFSDKCRDTLLTLSDTECESYDLMKGSLIEGFGLTTEEYRVKFTDTVKSTPQTWVDFVD